MVSRLLLVSALSVSTALFAIGCCGAAPPPSGTPTPATSSTATATTSTTTTFNEPVGNCGHGPSATTCATRQTCCSGGMAESYYCASLEKGAMCPPLP